jgi:mRNA export factor
LRQAKPLASLACGGKVYSMDSAGSLLAAVTSQNKIEVVDLKNPTAIEQTLPSNRLAHQIRVLSCFASGEGFALGGVEGRCAFTFIDPKKARFDTTSILHCS